MARIMAGRIRGWWKNAQPHTMAPPVGNRGLRSQGGVKVPTGGDGIFASARERLAGMSARVSRFGAIPKPTVTVRMEEKESPEKSNLRCIAPRWRVERADRISGTCDGARPPAVHPQPAL